MSFYLPCSILMFAALTTGHHFSICAIATPMTANTAHARARNAAVGKTSREASREEAWPSSNASKRSRTVYLSSQTSSRRQLL